MGKAALETSNTVETLGTRSKNPEIQLTRMVIPSCVFLADLIDICSGIVLTRGKILIRMHLSLTPSQTQVMGTRIKTILDVSSLLMM